MKLHILFLAVIFISAIARTECAVSSTSTKAVAKAGASTKAVAKAGSSTKAVAKAGASAKAVASAKAGANSGTCVAAGTTPGKGKAEVPDKKKPTPPVHPGDKKCALSFKECKGDLTFRRYDGSCNNLKNPTWGVPLDFFKRLIDPKYSDGIKAPRKGVNGNELPSARVVRTSLFPAGEKSGNKLNLNAMQFGQVITHDMSFLKNPERPVTCCTKDSKLPTTKDDLCFYIPVPKSDITMGKAGIECLNFTRAHTDRDKGCGVGKQPARPVNSVTAWLDLSLVYSNTEEKALELRTMKGGLMKNEIKNGVEYMPRLVNYTRSCRCNANPQEQCYMSGDVRSNQSPHLVILQTLFVREHNRLAKELATLNPHWNDERLFQEARRINIAEFQHISYYEWTPLFLGHDWSVKKKLIYPEAKSFVDDYDSNVSPKVTDAQAQAAFRFYHTAAAGSLNMVNPDRSIKSSLKIRNLWDRPDVLGTSSAIKQLTMGMVTQPFGDVDEIETDAIVDHMFNCKQEGFGRDLRAMDFQRDRDFGLGYYNDYRKYCGLKAAKCWDDYTDLIPKEKVEKMKKLYKDYRDVDVSVGGSLEKIAPDAQCGPTFRCITTEQFLRTRKADRQWFEHTGSGFTNAQLAEIRKSSIARLLCDGGDGIDDIQKKAFMTISKSNPVVCCEEIPKLNLSAWKEKPKKK